jgi:hypothetical protein
MFCILLYFGLFSDSSKTPFFLKFSSFLNITFFITLGDLGFYISCFTIFEDKEAFSFLDDEPFSRIIRFFFYS